MHSVHVIAAVLIVIDEDLPVAVELIRAPPGKASVGIGRIGAQPGGKTSLRGLLRRNGLSAERPRLLVLLPVLHIPAQRNVSRGAARRRA